MILYEFSDSNVCAMCRLCYHYKMSNAHHSAAYKYTVKAADHFISISSYKEGLMYARSAYEMASTRTELRELLVVTRAALSDIKPTMTRRLKGTAFSKKAQSRNKYLAGFQQLKSQIKQKIEEYAEGGPMYSNSLRRPSTPLLWEAPYAHMNSNYAHNKSSDIQCILC